MGYTAPDRFSLPLRARSTKLDDITSSLESITTPLQRALLRQILDHIDDLNRRVAVLDGMVEQYMAEYTQALDAIDEIPGIARRSAQVILAEIGLGHGPVPQRCPSVFLGRSVSRQSSECWKTEARQDEQGQ